MTRTIEDVNRPIVELRKRLDPLFEQIARVIVGQRAMTERLVIGLLTGGHLLLEGVPGLAKTLAIRTLARCLDLSFHRIQFTPDLLPADVIGTQVFNPRTGEFTVKKGPIFANFVLADEINRAPAKVQSALLEAMQERQVTIGEQSFALGEPFLVLATQNPIEHEGTYPLPEAQVDRFMLKIKITYPSRDEEMTVLDRMSRVVPDTSVDVVLSGQDVLEMRSGVDQIYVDPKIRQYVVDIVRASRDPGSFGLDIQPYIELGVGTRGAIFLLLAAKGHAFLRGRGFVTPEDVKAVAHDVLRHRIILTFEAEAEDITSDDLIDRILKAVSIDVSPPSG